MLKRVFTIFFILTSSLLFAQNDSDPSRVFSPYSQYGIGELRNDFYARNFGMANVGISNYDPYSANMLNPALLEKNKYTIFDVNVGYSQKSYNQNGAINNQSNGGINALAVVLPISYRWSTGFSLTPLSEIAYQGESFSNIPGDTVRVYNVEYAEGGMQRFGWSNGFNVLKGLNFGFGVGYNFGNRLRENETSLSSGGTRPTVTTANERIYGFDYEVGTSYSKDVVLAKGDSSDTKQEQTIYYLNNRVIKNLSKLTPEELAKVDTIIKMVGKPTRKFRIDFGATYNGSLDWDKRIYTDSDFFVDQVNYGFRDTTMGTMTLPTGLGVGLTLGNVRDTLNWKVSFEYSMKSWSQFREDGVNFNLPDVQRMAMGIEFTPEVNSYSEGFNGIFKRATYRAGVYQSNSPYIAAGKQLEEVGIHFGVSFVERQKRLGNRSYRWFDQDEEAGLTKSRHYLSRLNVGFAIGRMGMNEATAIQQTFFKLNIGLSLNNEWFVRRKIN